MNFECGLELNSILNLFVDVAHAVYNHSEEERDFEKRKLINSIDLLQAYKNFTYEFYQNILDYDNDELIMEYLYSCFTGPKGIFGIEFLFTDKEIVRNQTDVAFILKLKHAVEKYQTVISKYLVIDLQNTKVNVPLAERFKIIQKDLFHLLNEGDPLYFDTDGRIDELFQQLKDENSKDERFYIQSIQAECEKLASTELKINFIKKRKLEFEQWKQHYVDNKNKELMLALGKFISVFYRGFDRFCMEKLVEFDELDKKESEQESLLPLSENTPNPAGSYVWHATDTDMLELSIALLKAEIVRRTDGRKITHEEMTGLLENTFGHEIKDAKGKLSKAVTRKKSVTPFLDSLKTAFEEYCRERDEN